MCSFLWLSNIPLCICTTTSLSILLLRDIQGASMFWLLKIVLQLTVGYMCLFQFWFPQGIAQEWDCWVRWWFYSQFLKDSPYRFPQWLCQFTFPPTVQECSLFFTPSPTFILLRLFDDGHSDWCEMIFHCSFDLHFSNNEQR